MILYRIEHKISKKGPYTSGYKSITMMLNYCDCPAPDFNFSNDYKFGIIDLEELYRIFNPALQTMFNNNFHIIKIDIAEEYVRGNEIQVAYLATMENVIETISIDLRKIFQIAA